MRNGFYHQKDHMPDRLMRWRKLPAEAVRSDSNPPLSKPPDDRYRADNQDYQHQRKELRGPGPRSSFSVDLP